ncbi:MAG: HAMP domain-containing histidine kinase [Luteimonas sp.]|nr:HAMP domain-containing histidine kinase [Luteimonas sp.]
MPQGLPKRIRFAFVTQALLAVLAVLVGVMAVAWLARNALVEHWLDAEATGFWSAMEASGGQARPGSALVGGWFVAPGATDARLPEHLLNVLPGHSTLPGGQGKVLLSRSPAGDLYLVMPTGEVDRIVVLAAAGLIAFGAVSVLLITWLTYRRSRRMVLPINRLSDVVMQWDPGGWDATVPIVLPYPLAADTSKEMRALSTALGGLATRVADFVQRERDFTRDASHELRTPLTIVRVASDMMLGDPSMPPHAQRSLQRIQRAVQDMESLVDAFLILARERGVEPQSEEFDVVDVVADEVEKVRPLLEGKSVELRVAGNAAPRMFAPPRVLGVMLGHLLSNACTFTDSGSIEVEIEADAIRIRDTGIGMSADTLRHAYDPFFRADQFNPIGKGIGLTIVRRLGDRFGWPVTLESVPGEGTLATVRLFPAAN